ncbi:hypothetical protein K2173_005552 [Erythroxylum novogranatense]|uniref:Uncharacterized protein n=1 Tax=Erythroxylum novogranatense TaxID=1862640 RepID=A0AAV8SKT0_9ROSI|nr:hypothetical protein K2173_005552 [Erythroxylum novogranatense]
MMNAKPVKGGKATEGNSNGYNPWTQIQRRNLRPPKQHSYPTDPRPSMQRSTQAGRDREEEHLAIEIPSHTEMICDTQIIKDSDLGFEECLQLMEGIEDQEVVCITREGHTTPPIGHLGVGTRLDVSKDLNDEEIALPTLDVDIQVDPAARTASLQS